MASYKLVLTHGNRHGEGVHIFDAADDLMTHSPATVIRITMDAMEKEMASPSIGHLDYEIFSCLKNGEKGVVSALGELIFHGTQREPFTALISAAD